VVERARLESVYTSKGYRGFESLPLRKMIKSAGNERFLFDSDKAKSNTFTLPQLFVLFILFYEHAC
jgi:hypothetical protein